MGDLKTCACYESTWVSADGVTTDRYFNKCVHCVEVEKVARELVRLATNWPVDLIERARAVGLLED